MVGTLNGLTLLDLEQGTRMIVMGRISPWGLGANKDRQNVLPEVLIMVY